MSVIPDQHFGCEVGKQALKAILDYIVSSKPDQGTKSMKYCTRAHGGTQEVRDRPIPGLYGETHLKNFH